MHVKYNQESNPNTMISPHSFRHLYGGSDERGGRARSESATVTPCTTPGTRASIEREWMARCMMRREAAERYNNELRGSGDGFSISPIERKEVSRAVYGILRDNLPQSLEQSTSQEELTLIADSIEAKLYQTAASPRAYSAFSTLEFRITALATAVLIHSDKKSSNQRGISDTCARLSAAARKSLVYCVMVLVSFEKRNMEKHQASPMGGSRRMASSLIAQRNNELQQRQGNSSKRTMEDGYSRECAAAEYYRSLKERASDYHQSEEGKSSSSDCGRDKSTNGGDNNSVNVQIVLEDVQKVQPFPPTA